MDEIASTVEQWGIFQEIALKEVVEEKEDKQMAIPGAALSMFDYFLILDCNAAYMPIILYLVLHSGF